LAGLVRRKGINACAIEVTIEFARGVIIYGDLSASDRAVLQTAAVYCPVSQMFMGLHLDESFVFED
jgi:hypothetical protein